MNRLKNLRILVVEDDEKIRDLLFHFFKSMNNECHLAKDGGEGFQKVMESHYDFVLMDLKMPVMNGIDCIQSIRQVDPYIPILIMSGTTSQSEKNESIKSGGNGFITKPFDLEEISIKMNSILEGCSPLA